MQDFAREKEFFCRSKENPAGLFESKHNVPGKFKTNINCCGGICFLLQECYSLVTVPNSSVLHSKLVRNYLSVQLNLLSVQVKCVCSARYFFIVQLKSLHVVEMPVLCLYLPDL